MKVLFLLAFLIWTSNIFAENIKGRVVANRFPIPDIEIEIENGGSSKTNTNGEFNVTVEKIPYNITLISKRNFVAVRYEGLTTLDPELKMFNYSSVNNYNKEYIKVEFLKVPENSEGIVQFLSSDISYSSAAKIKSGMSSVGLTVQWPKDKESIQGYIFYLERTGDQYTKYIQYQATITKSSNFTQKIIIPQHFMGINPGTSVVTIDPFNSSFENKGYEISADFPALGRNAEIILPIKNENGGIMRAIVPTALPFEYRLKLRTSVRGINGSGFTSYSYMPANTTTVFPKNETAPRIIAPQNTIVNYDTTTIFSYGQDFGFGVYVVCFSSIPSPFPPPNPANSSFYIVTTNNIIKHPLENSYGILKGNYYNWYVSNYTGFRNVNDFVTPVEPGRNYNESTVTYSERKNLEFNFN